MATDKYLDCCVSLIEGSVRSSELGLAYISIPVIYTYTLYFVQ